MLLLHGAHKLHKFKNAVFIATDSVAGRIMHKATIATDHKQDVINTIGSYHSYVHPAERDSPSIDAITVL